MLKKIFTSLFRRYTVAQYRKVGVSIGVDCRFIGKIDFGSEPYLIKIGNYVSITNSTFITHDGGVWIFRDEYPKIDVIAPIVVGNNVFIGSGCVILPNVIIGDNVVIGAGSVVTKSIPSNTVYAGVPARIIQNVDDYKNKVLRKTLDTKQLSSKEKKKYLLQKYGLY